MKPVETIVQELRIKHRYKSPRQVFEHHADLDLGPAWSKARIDDNQIKESTEKA